MCLERHVHASINGQSISDKESSMARIITIASGKGGVGRTTISANLAIGLARLGFRTCLFDADMGLADINILFGFYPEYDLKEVVFGQRSLGDILIQHNSGIDIIPGNSGDEKMADLAPEKLEYIIGCLSDMSDTYDFIIVDSASGISRDVVSFCMTSSDIILLLAPEPISFIDSYSFLKVLCSKGYDGPVWTVFNRVSRRNNATILFSKFKKTIQDFLDVNIEPLGSIMQDPNVLKASRRQKPCMSFYRNSPFSTCIMNMVHILVTKGECTIKPFASLGLKIQSIETLKRNLLGLNIRWKIAKKKVFPRPAETEKKPGPEDLPAGDVQPSEVGLAPTDETLPADPHIIADEWRGHSETRDPINENSFREATLIELDFESFANSRCAV